MIIAMHIKHIVTSQLPTTKLQIYILQSTKKGNIGLHEKMKIFSLKNKQTRKEIQDKMENQGNYCFPLNTRNNLSKAYKIQVSTYISGKINIIFIVTIN